MEATYFHSRSDQCSVFSIRRRATSPLAPTQLGSLSVSSLAMASRPPQRQRAFARPFPTLALLSIYSSVPVPSSTPPAGRQDDAAVEASKILFFSAAEELTVERKARLMGTVMGMADFAR